MRAVIADDHPLYREAVGLRLQRQLSEAEIVEVGDLDELMALAGGEEKSVDLILLDLRMPGMKGGRSVEEVIAAFPEAAVVLVSGAASYEDIKGAIDAGARGFMPKTLSSKLFAGAISLVLTGGTFLPAETLQMNGTRASSGAARAQPEDSAVADALTLRQRQVLVQLAAGATNKEIGRNLDIAEVTVKLHIGQILRRINARNRAEAASIATRAGLIWDGIAHLKNTQPVQKLTDGRRVWHVGLDAASSAIPNDLCNGVEAGKGRLACPLSLVHMASQVSPVLLPELVGRSSSPLAMNESSQPRLTPQKPRVNLPLALRA